jgi:hypothetical protein
MEEAVLPRPISSRDKEKHYFAISIERRWMKLEIFFFCDSRV